MVKLNHYSINDDKNTYSQTNKIIENFGLEKTVEFFDASNLVQYTCSTGGSFNTYNANTLTHSQKAHVATAY